MPHWPQVVAFQGWVHSCLPAQAEACACAACESLPLQHQLDLDLEIRET